MQDFLSAYFVVCVGFIVHAKRTCTDEFIYFRKKEVALRLELSMALPSDLCARLDCLIRWMSLILHAKVRTFAIGFT